MIQLLILIALKSLDLSQIESKIDRGKDLETRQKYDSAYQLYLSALSEAKLLGHDKKEAEIVIRLATILGKTGDLHESRSKFQAAHKIALQTKSIKTQANALLGIGNLCYLSNQLDSAAIYYGQALPLFSVLGDTFNLRGTKNNLAMILKRGKKPQQTISILTDLLTQNTKDKDTSALISNHRNLALVYLGLRDHSKARDHFTQTLTAASALGSLKDEIFARNGLAKVYLAQNKIDSAFEQFLNVDSLFGLYLHQDQSDKILELETKFRTAEIERDNAIKQAQIETQEQRMLYLYIIAGFLGLAILGVYLYNEQRKKIIRALALQRENENAQRIEDLLKQQELKSAYAMLAGQEKAHKRIAMELHDNLGSILVTLNMFADTLQKKTKPEDQKKLAQKISEVAQVANEATRKISHSLDSGVLKHFGLETAIKELINALNESETIEVSSHVQVTEKLDSELSLNVYRIIQELINNTLKHAHASKINIDLNQIKDNLSLIYEDNGVGFEMSPDHPKGMGLRNLESRVDNMDGTITIESKKDKGTTTIIEIPIT